MKEDLKEWISKMTEKIKDSTLVWKNADIAQTLYYLQKQIAISNEIELKKIELQYLNKEIPKYNIPITIQKKDDDNKYKITMT